MLFKAAHNIGVAVDTIDGLMVPNIKNVETKSVYEIAADLNRLQLLAHSSKLGPNELVGGTFTISNLGSVCIYQEVFSIEMITDFILFVIKIFLYRLVVPI